ncbi:phosphotriesterase-related protein [Oceanotoga sp. DSM 15011]|jgi:phosphotriesterase-related protein|uniref:Phosphotriesterase-related protein n=1 Tax=Oceanotoga teriensis TaxID=515440 RepID=A0AA45C694_9BACT|nr:MULTISPECIES: phosphotriesterase-related protein [Oceanotoga]MDN5342652.1 phosphotriesterase-related protein [Oceanotoga sp.]MDO7975976.1 phosphotriesterase-related protein [Oceanotoga teriensis]PWJ92014.1 phosphotriesterase-related protein [Oceanotoga teriensis]UYO99034.1 phosphotriesterase-related protein [Oceanotoga sp. DSM 15011]
MLKNGYTYMHEHMRIDLSGVKKDPDCRLDCYDQTKEELLELMGKNVKNIVEVTNMGMGRDIGYILKLREETGMNFIFSTGYYKEPFLPDEVYTKTKEELAKIMENEIINGIENYGVKAQIIGEVGSSKDKITPAEEKVLRAAAIAHNNTGRPITTHTSLGTMGLEQIELFKEMNANLDKIILGHTDLTGDIEYIEKLIQKGVYVEIDTIGKLSYLSDEKRIEILTNLCKKGLSERIVLSVDITRKSHLKYKGGIGYSYLLDKFIPELIKNGVKDTDIENMLINNPKKILESE